MRRLDDEINRASWTQDEYPDPSTVDPTPMGDWQGSDMPGQFIPEQQLLQVSPSQAGNPPQTSLPDPKQDPVLSALSRFLVLTRPVNLIPKRFGILVPAGSSLMGQSVSAKKPPCDIRIYIAMSTAGTLTVSRKSDDNPTFTSTEQMNGLAGSLLANTAYYFDIALDDRESFDLTYSVAGTIQKLSVWELDFISG